MDPSRAQCRSGERCFQFECALHPTRLCRMDFVPLVPCKDGAQMGCQKHRVWCAYTPLFFAFPDTNNIVISVEGGPTVVFMTVTMLLLFGSAFFTDVIGVHAIFGKDSQFVLYTASTNLRTY